MLSKDYMLLLTIHLVAVLFYLAGAIYQGRFLIQSGSTPPKRHLLLIMGGIAVIAHAVSLSANLFHGHIIDLSFYTMLSLIFWFIATVALLSTLRRPTDNLLVILFPLAALFMAISSLVTPYHGAHHDLHIHYPTNLSAGMLIHILSSILAYSILTMAAIQAALLALQDYQLRHHHLHGIIRALPPLQTMEQLLFELVGWGVTLLSVAIVTGFMFVENLFAQHLVHKTVLTVAAWCIFVILLWGHYHLGWRSQMAVRWTLGGFIALLLGYIGSKWVLEIVLEVPPH